jgi:hypothetical protein
MQAEARDYPAKEKAPARRPRLKFQEGRMTGTSLPAAAANGNGGPRSGVSFRLAINKPDDNVLLAPLQQALQPPLLGWKSVDLGHPSADAHQTAHEAAFKANAVDAGVLRDLTDSKGCRRKAAECELAARLSRDVEMRTMYRDLAQLWREVASELEHLEATKQAVITCSQS